MTDMLLGFGQDGEMANHTPEQDPQQQYILGNPNLPIANHRAEIERSANENVFTIIKATTGSGKSTQVAQYLYEMNLHGDLNIGQIILTQPRVLPTRTLSERITDEMRQSGITNPEVGYFTQPESSPSPQHLQKIAVATEGKVSKQLHYGTHKNLDGSLYLLIDEAHEMNVETELLLAQSKNKTDVNSPEYDENFRVFVMSATIDEHRLKKYFGHTSVGYIEVEVPTYKVSREISAESVAKVALRLVQDDATVLVFHSGKGEIETTHDRINEIQTAIPPDMRAKVVPLHAQQNAEQQALAFEQHSKGLIVLATNVAQTSLTIPAVVAVVDTGEERVASTSYEFVPWGHDELILKDISQADMDQRAGRSGRLREGTHVQVKQTGGGFPLDYKERIPYPVPSILRESLSSLELLVRDINSEISDFNFLHTPTQKAINAAKQKLHILGAIDDTGVITERGRRMETLPLNPEFACMFVYAEERGFNSEVKQNVLDIVAIMQRGGIVSRSPKKRAWMELLERNDNDEIKEQDSDYFAQLEVYVKLIDEIEAEFWEGYNVDAHAVELVAQRRESLAKAVGLSNIGPATVVEPKNRAAVLECIHAGQLTQLWRRNGDRWNLLLAPTIDFDAHPSSVVGAVGRLATGSLFTLGMREDEKQHNVQDINRVLDISTLDTIANHLVKEVPIPGSEVFIPERNIVVYDVERRLGSMVLKVVKKEINPSDSEESMQIVGAKYTEHLRKLHAQNTKENGLEAYNPKDLDMLIQQPESSYIGTNIYTGETIYEWYGADRRPMRTEQDARNSLTALKARLDNEPLEQERRLLKNELDILRKELVAIGTVNKGTSVAKEAKLLRQARKNTPEYLELVKEFIALHS